MSVSKLLKQIQENPDDLSNLPKAIAEVERIENEEATYQDRIAKLQDINKNYLAQIPVPSNDPHAQDEQKEQEPTVEDAKEHIINAMNGGEQ